MPNFVKVDSKPFHPDTYVGPEHEDDFSGGTHERDMGIKLRVENTVRWRWTKDKDDQDVSPLVTLFFHPITRILSLRGGAASAVEHARYPMVGWFNERPTGQRVF